MRTPTEAGTRNWPARRWAFWGFLIGVAITVPATFFALLSRTGEALHPYLAPSTKLLGPLSELMADWPGLVNMAVASLVNGVAFAAIAGALGAVLTKLHR